MKDPRFDGLAARTRNIDGLYSELAKCIAPRTTADWLETCDRLDIPAAPMRRLADLEKDPHLAQTGFFTSIEDPSMGPLVMPAAPLRFDGAKAVHSLPPRLGQHTVEVLTQAGLTRPDIEKLLGTGAAVQAKT